MRRNYRLRTTTALLLAVALVLGSQASGQKPAAKAEPGKRSVVVRMRPIQEGGTSVVFEVHGLQPKTREALTRASWKEADWQVFLAVYVAKGSADLRQQPGILGTHK